MIKKEPKKREKFLTRIRKTTSRFIKRIFKERKKEEKKLPEPITKKAKKKRVKRFFSSIWDFSPWSVYKKQRIKEIEKELADLKRERRFPKTIKSDFEEVIPEEPPPKKKPVKPLILDDDFAAERFRAQNAIEYFRDKIASFAKEPPGVEVDIDSALLADGSVIIQARFWGWDPEDFDGFTLDLEALMHTIAVGSRISLVHQWDPRKLSVPYEIEKDKIKIGKTELNIFKGLVDVPMNVSNDIAYSFENFRGSVYDGLLDSTEQNPHYVTARIVWGESVLKMGRESIRI